MKINEKDTEKEVVGHYFNKGIDDEDYKTILQLNSQILKGFRSNKLIVACKESNCGLWEKNIFKTDIGFSSLGNSNEVTKSVREGKTKFDVIMRVR